MTHQEIIEMARQANATEIGHKPPAFHFYLKNLEAFAKLIADKKHQELYRLAEEAPVRGDARETRQNILHAIRGEA
jgi:hypothetical protein